MLKMKSSRAFFSEMDKRFPSMPFSIRQFNDVTGAKVGVTECLNHDMIIPYPVLEEKCQDKNAGPDLVAQFKSTVAIMPRSTAVLCGNIANPNTFESEIACS